MWDHTATTAVLEVWLLMSRRVAVEPADHPATDWDHALRPLVADPDHQS